MIRKGLDGALINEYDFDGMRNGWTPFQVGGGQREDNIVQGKASVPRMGRTVVECKVGERLWGRDCEGLMNHILKNLGGFHR